MNTRSGSRKRLKEEAKRRDSTIDPVVTEAMTNDVILKHLFELMEVRGLNTVRQVSKHWYNVSLPVWLKNGPPIALTNDRQFKRFVSRKGHAAAATTTTGSHGRHNNSLEIVGIRRYPKFQLKMDHYEIRDHDLFWELHGDWLTHLTIRYSRIPGVVRFLNILTCKFTPKLEYLEVNCFHHSLTNPEVEVDEVRELPMDVVGAENWNLKEFRIDFDEPGPLPMDWKTLLSHYPKLEHLMVGRELSARGRALLGMEPILAAIREIRNEDKERLNLKSLIWFYDVAYRDRFFDRTFNEVNPLPPSVPEVLRQAKLCQVQAFRIDFYDGESDELINNILSAFGSSLKKLEFHKLSLLQHHPFRNVEQLQSLTLTGYPVKNLLFLTHLPALRSLSLWAERFDRGWRQAGYARSIISETNNNNNNNNAPGLLTFPSLTQFGCNYTVEWTDVDLRRLRDLTPNLTELELNLTNPSFRLICQLWPRLEHLADFGGKIGDKGIVGLVKNGPEIVYDQPNITSLTELKSFAMDSLGSRALSKRDFSEHSVLAGFANLARLERLTIKTYSINPATKKLILSKFPFAKIKERKNEF